MSVVTPDEYYNVIQFPNRRQSDVSEIGTITSMETAIHSAREGKQYFAEEVIEFAMDQTFAIFENFGIRSDKLDTPSSTKDLCFLEEAIRSTLYRYYGLEHSLHDFVDEHIPDLPSE